MALLWTDSVWNPLRCPRSTGESRSQRASGSALLVRPVHRGTWESRRLCFIGCPALGLLFNNRRHGPCTTRGLGENGRERRLGSSAPRLGPGAPMAHIRRAPIDPPAPAHRRGSPAACASASGQCQWPVPVASASARQLTRFQFSVASPRQPLGANGSSWLCLIANVLGFRTAPSQLAGQQGASAGVRSC
jgi:hypothetical protein